MQLLNYDFYDLYALLIFFRADTDKVSEYAEVIEQIVHCLEEPVSQSEIEGNAVRKILQTYVSETEQGLSWVWTENKYTGNVVIMKNAGHYRILSEVFQEMLRSMGDGRRLWYLCDATHNIPTLLVECKDPKKAIKSMAKRYQKEYNKNFLVEELKQLDK